MLNFCLSCFNTKVTSNQVSSDGYEVTNLVSSDVTRKCKGFLAYNAIKPPVEINFELICDINISHIIIWPQVGQQKSCGFKIEVGQKTQTHLSNLITVGQSYIENDGIVFKGNNCRVRDIEVPENFSITYLSNKKNVLHCCSFIKLSVIKTLNSTLPAIKSVEIWGECSVTCSPELKAEICQTWQSYKNHSNKIETVNKIKCTEVKRLTTKDLVVPDDFIDPITCEIMAIPMILPCGKIIDRSTLEKHEKVEAAWGRMPNDPFTGKLFTESNHPIIAFSLKSRIDKFLVDNSDKVELFSVPRTLGRCSKDSAPGLKNCHNNASLSYETSVTVTNSKRRKTQSIYECEGGKKFICNPDINVLGVMAERKPISLVSSTSDEELDLSLEHALKNTLSGLPSFLKSTNDRSISKLMCGDCTQIDVLYTLPCNHFLCRKCLLQILGKQQLSCSQCHHMFNKSDVSRINT